MSIHPQAQVIAQRLFEVICAGQFSMGAKITEPFICQHLNVSRTHVREALLYLVNSRVVEAIPKKGYYIVQLTPCKLNQFVEIVESVSQYGVGRLIAQTSSIDYRRVLQLFAQMEEAIEKQHAPQFNLASLGLFQWLLDWSANTCMQQESIKIRNLSTLIMGLNNIKRHEMERLLDNYYQSYYAVQDRSLSQASHFVSNIIRMRYVISRWDIHQMSLA